MNRGRLAMAGVLVLFGLTLAWVLWTVQTQAGDLIQSRSDVAALSRQVTEDRKSVV